MPGKPRVAITSTENSFADEEFLSADEKRRVLRAWIRFLKSGCCKTQFTKELYQHLYLHCSFIAHYDRHGFYQFYFERISSDLFRFFDQFDPAKSGISAEGGTVHWLGERCTGADLNRAMREAAANYMPALRLRFEESHRQAELTMANRLLAKHGYTAVPAQSVSELDEQRPSPAVNHIPMQTALFGDLTKLHSQ